MKLKEIVNVESGLLSSRIPQGEDNVKFLTNTAFNDVGISNVFEEKMCDKEKIQKYLLKKGDVVIRNVDPFQPLYINEDEVVMTNIAFKMAVKGEGISAIDIFEILCSNDFKNYLRKEVKGTGILRITKRELENYEFNNTNSEINQIKFNARVLLDLKHEEIKLYNELINGEYTNLTKGEKNE